MRFFVLAFVLLQSGLTLGQNCTYTFRGTLKDFHDNSILSDAHIYLKTENRSFISDDQGNFKIEEVCLGTIELVISHIACETKILTFLITGDMTETILLEHHIESLNEISINTTINRTITKTGQEAVIKTSTIEEFSSGSLGDITKTITGVSSLNTGTNIVKPIIHGLHSSRIITMQDGVRMQDQEWGLEHSPTIDVNALETIALVKGASALAYSGDAIGGAIILKPNKYVSSDSLFGKTIAVFDSNNKGYTVSSSFTKTSKKGWYIGGQGSYRRFGDSKTPDYILSNTGLDFKAFSLQTGFNDFEQSFNAFYSFVDNTIGILSSSHIGDIEQLITAINEQVPGTILDFTYDIKDPKQRIKHQLAKASYQKRFANLGKLTLQYDYQRNERLEYDRRRGDFKGIPSIDLMLQTHGVQGQFLFDRNNKFSVRTGIQFQYLDNFPDPATGVRRLIPDYTRYDLGAFITSEWKLDNNFVMEGALRYDYNRIDALKYYRIISWEEQGYDQDFSNIIVLQDGGQYLTNPIYNFNNISIALGAKKRLGNHEISFNYALSNRPPNVSELFSDGLHQSVARVELGNLRLNKETANQFSASYTFQSNKISLAVDPYVNSIKNYIFLAPTPQGIRVIGNAGAFLEYEFLATDALLYGIDLNFNYSLSQHLNFQNSTAFLVGRDVENNVPLIDMPPFNSINTIQYQKEDWMNLSIGLTSELFTTQNNYPDYNFLYTLPSTGEEVLVDVSTPPPGYHLLHFRSSIQASISKGLNLEIAFNIQNLFNTRYRNYLNRLRFFADEVGRNFQLQLKLNY